MDGRKLAELETWILSLRVRQDAITTRDVRDRMMSYYLPVVTQEGFCRWELLKEENEEARHEFQVAFRTHKNEINAYAHTWTLSGLIGWMAQQHRPHVTAWFHVRNPDLQLSHEMAVKMVFKLDLQSILTLECRYSRTKN